ncbi:MAG: beta-ketoacyl-ACP synthase III [Geminicoccaceae bacterium]
MTRSVLRSVASFLPARALTNEDLSLRLDTSDEWIRERTGIGQRYIAEEGQLTSDLATGAARLALERAGIQVGAVDLILVATATPDHTFPATATAVMRKLGAGPCMAFDVQAVCAGFAYALTVADSLIRTRQAHNALVIGAETFSRILDWEDRSTCVLFGDGAGAVVLTAASAGDEHGILACATSADGRFYDELHVDGGPSSTGSVGKLRMNGREVFRHAVSRLAGAALEVVEAAGLTIGDVDWLVPHQANIRIIDAVGKRLGLPAEKTVVTVERHGNTSAASIPLALDTAWSDGRVKSGDLVLMNAMGGGFAWGAVLARI